MKKFAAAILIFTVFAASAGELEDLLKKFETEYATAEKELSENAETTVELVSAAGGCSILSEKHLFQAFDYKLRHTINTAERLQIIADFYKLSKDVQKLHQTPREGMGSLAGMHIYYAEAELMRQQIAVWMLDTEAEKRWKRIANAPLVLKGQKIELYRGKAKFDAVMYEQQITLEIVLFPQNTFTHRGRDFAIIRTDIQFAGNDDFSTVYLCEVKNGKLQVAAQFKMPYVTQWVLEGNKLKFIGDKNEKEEIIL